MMQVLIEKPKAHIEAVEIQKIVDHMMGPIHARIEFLKEMCRDNASYNSIEFKLEQLDTSLNNLAIILGDIDD